MNLNIKLLQRIRAELLAICGPEKYNTLIRQRDEVVERGKLRYWQQELFDNYIQQQSIPIDAFSLYVQAFHEAEAVAVPEKPFVYPLDPADAIVCAVARSDLTKIQECFQLESNVVEILATRKLPSWLMCEAGKHASTASVKLLAELGCNIDQSDSNIFTGLGWAVAYDRYEVAVTFLELGADPNKGLPIFNVMASSNPVSLAKLLIDYGADPHRLKPIDSGWMNVLSLSIARGQQDLANYFLELGVQPYDA